MTQIEFADLGLPEPLLRAVSERNFVHPTPIQAQSIPPLLQGRDLLGIAQTGSGKTAAFVLPILARIGADRSRPAAFMARALILAPTRELAQQIEETVRQLSAGLRLNVVLIVGGASRFRQASAMRRGADVVVGTPGRVMDLMGSRELDLSLVGDFVLDEADRMLDMGFLPDVRRIVDTLPSRRRSAMFSATMPREIAGLADGLLRDPARVEIERAPETIPQIEQSVYHLPRGAKMGLLRDMLADPAFKRVIVFARTKHGANRIAETLEDEGHQVDALHGNKSQSQRDRALRDFRTGRARVLIATDLAARGIDVTQVTHVINYDLPVDAESYVHRIGRTARAGNSGIAISLCDPEEFGALRAIERLIGERIRIAGGQEPMRGRPQPPRPPQRHGHGGQAPANHGAAPHGQGNRAPQGQRPHGAPGGGPGGAPGGAPGFKRRFRGGKPGGKPSGARQVA